MKLYNIRLVNDFGTCDTVMSFIVYPEHHSSTKQLIVFKCVAGKIVQLIIPCTPACDVDALFFPLTHQHRTYDLVAVKVQGLHLVLDLVTEHLAHVGAERWVVGKLPETILKNIFDDFFYLHGQSLIVG